MLVLIVIRLGEKKFTIDCDCSDPSFIQQMIYKSIFNVLKINYNGAVDNSNLCQILMEFMSQARGELNNDMDLGDYTFTVNLDTKIMVEISKGDSIVFDGNWFDLNRIKL